MGGRVGGAASFSLPFEQFYIQGDLLIDYSDFTGGNLTSLGAGGHLGWRDASVGNLGLALAYNNIDATGAQSIDIVRVGGEGEIFLLGDLTVGAKFGYFDVSQGGGDAYYGGAHARAYFAPDTKLELGLVYTDISPGPSSTVFQAHGEHRLSGLPISLFARGEYFTTTSVDIASLIGGVRIYFGEYGDKSIMQYDRENFQDACTLTIIAAQVC